MTEDDTFLALRKPSYTEMYEIWANSELIKEPFSLDKSEYKIKAFFRRYGWDVDEYSNMSMDRKI